jgi:hypothetical protein
VRKQSPRLVACAAVAGIMLSSPPVVAQYATLDGVDWSHPEQLAHLPADDLCNLYRLARGRGDAAKGKAVQNAITAIGRPLDVRSFDWPDIDQGIVQMGMSPCG